MCKDAAAKLLLLPLLLPLLLGLILALLVLLVSVLLFVPAGHRKSETLYSTELEALKLNASPKPYNEGIFVASA